MKLFPSILCIALLPLSIFADQTKDEIDAALKAYQAGRYGEASVALQQALVYVNEKKSEQLSQFFPQTVIGLTGAKIDTQKGAVLFGAAGAMINRRYAKDKMRCRVQLAVDSPLMTQYTSYMNNPQIAAAMGLKTRRVNGVKVMYKEQDKSLTMIYNNRFVIQIDAVKEMDEKQVFSILQELNFAILDGFK